MSMARLAWLDGTWINGRPISGCRYERSLEKGFNLISRMIYYHIAFALQPSSCGKIKAQDTEGTMQLILNIDKPIFTDPPVSHHFLCMRVRVWLLYSFKLGYRNNKGQDQLWISYHHGGKLGGGWLYVSQENKSH